MTIPTGIDNGTFAGYADRLNQRNTDPAAFVPVFRRWSTMNDGTDTVSIVSWPGSPEGNIVGDIGSLGLDSTNGAIYVKTIDTANTGWVLVGSSTGNINSVDVDAATAPGTDPVLPNVSGQISILGANPAAQAIPVRTHANTAANRFDVEVQMSSAQALDTPTANGLSHFDSSQFSVSATGFVQSLASVAFVWQDFAGGAMAITNGYFATAAAAYTLPAGVTDGDTVEIVDQIGGGVVVTAQGGDFIQVSNVLSSANGTATSTQSGDSARFVWRATNQTWLAVPGVSGNWVLA